MVEVFLFPGCRTPFVKVGGHYAKRSALELSSAVTLAMTSWAKPDLLVWGQAIPDPTVSNIARELVFKVGLDPRIPAFSTVLACSTGFMSAIVAAGQIGRGGTHLVLAGGVETMSHIPVALNMRKADEVLARFRRDRAQAAVWLSSQGTDSFDLPVDDWANGQTGRSQGEHTEDTVKHFEISRTDQDALALKSHQAAIDAIDNGFFDDLVISFDDVDHDTIPRRRTSLDQLGRLQPVFSADGTLTAGNSSSAADGAASVWVADREGIARLGAEPQVRLVDWELAAMDFREESEAILMSPARAIPRLLARHRLTFSDVASWNIHEAFAAQVIANVRAASDPTYRKEKAGVVFDFGTFPWSRLNTHGGSLALGHPCAATGARLLSQATKELTTMPIGTKGIVSICADSGQGTVALLERA